MRRVGAHEVIDYAKPDPYRGLAPFDIVADFVGGDHRPWLALLGAGGRHVTTVPQGKVFVRSALNLFTTKKVRPLMMKNRNEDLKIVDRLVKQGQLRVTIDSRFKPQNLQQAMERSKSGHAAGKIIVEGVGR